MPLKLLSHPSEINPTKYAILCILCSEVGSEFSTSQISKATSKSTAYVRKLLNELHKEFTGLISKRKSGGSVPWHDELGKSGGPVTRDTVITYMKKNKIEVTPASVEYYFKLLWDEAEENGRWISVAPCYYSSSSELSAFFNGKKAKLN